ncbi:MAG: zinc dependent phospholipase C family protein, partial [Planctomycetota bacterium]
MSSLRIDRAVRTALAIAILVLGASPLWAFKITTHVWIGIQVIRDLEDDCRVRLPSHDGTIQDVEVHPEICNAILDYPEAYLMGCVGPDIYPDMIVGQMATHPGSSEGDGGVAACDPVNLWETDDWLKQVLSSVGDPFVEEPLGEQIAFAYGFLSHAAGDVFAHTYVNMYAGDAFGILDGEQEVELRHFTLESYIAARHPDFREELSLINGRNGEPLELDSLRAPTSFVRRALLGTCAGDPDCVPNTTLVAQYNVVPSGLGKHLAALATYANTVDQLVVIAEEELFGALDIATGEITTAIETLEETIEEMEVETFEGTDIEISTCCDGLAQAACCASGFNCCQPICGIRALEVTEHCITLADLRFQLGLANTTNFVYQRARNNISGVALLPLRTWQSEIRIAIDAYIDAWDQTAVEMLEGKGNPLEPGGEPTGPLLRWFKCYAPRLIPGGRLGFEPGDIPLDVACSVQDTYDEIRDEIEDAFLGELRDAFPGATEAFGEVYDEIRVFQEETLVDLSDEILSVFPGVPGKVENPDSLVRLLLRMHAGRGFEEHVAEEFETDSSPKGLIEFDDVLPLVHRDMGAADGDVEEGEVIFDLDAQLSAVVGRGDFTPVINTFRLSQLLLLDAAEINGIVADAGVSATDYGDVLYPDQPTESLHMRNAPFGEGDREPFNILFKAIRSIDGNHQWQEFAPSYPRREGARVPVGKQYGYGRCGH